VAKVGDTGPPTPAKAEKAAEELTAYDSRPPHIDHPLAVLTCLVGGLAVGMTVVGFPAIRLLMWMAAKIVAI
jgi:hypothetical protein